MVNQIRLMEQLAQSLEQAIKHMSKGNHRNRTIRRLACIDQEIASLKERMQNV